MAEQRLWPDRSVQRLNLQFCGSSAQLGYVATQCVSTSHFCTEITMAQCQDAFRKGQVTPFQNENPTPVCSDPFHSSHSCFQRLLENSVKVNKAKRLEEPKRRKILNASVAFEEPTISIQPPPKQGNIILCFLPAPLLISLINQTVLTKVCCDGQKVRTLRTCI